MSSTEADWFAVNVAAWPSGPPAPAVATDARVRVDVVDGVHVLLLEDAGQWVSVHSRRDPHRDAERLLQPVDADRVSTLFVVGLGLGYVLDALERRGWTGTVVAFEPVPAIAYACLQRRDWRDWLATGRLLILTGPDFEGLDRVVPSLSPDREEPAAIVNPVVARLHGSAVDAALHRAARAWFGARANQDARRRNGGRYLLNTLRNAPRLAAAAPVEVLADRFAGVPAVVVAAGPSLDDNVRAIAAYRDRGVVIAVDTALRPLLEQGIAPDLVVAVDPGEVNARHLVDLPPCPNVYCVSEGSVDPEALRTFDERLFIFRVGDHHPWPWLRERGVDCDCLRAWGSVLTTAFDLALRMGCDPIVFAGADLAFPDERPYARGTTFEEDWRRDAAWGQQVEESWSRRVAEWPETIERGVGGEPVRTAPHLIAFRDWLVTEATRATTRTIINGTERGVLIGEGVVQASIDDALAGRPAIDTSVRDAIAHAYAAGRRAAPWSDRDVPAAVLEQWSAFGHVPVDTILRALGRVGPSCAVPVEDPTVAGDNENTGDTGDDGAVPAAACAYPGLREGDASYLTALSLTHRVRVLSLDDPAQRLADDVAAHAAALGPGEALAIIDRAGLAVGAQVRRAINPLLCTRRDLWIEYRRFADYESRVTVLRADAASQAPRPDQADAEKWTAEHQGVAESLVPFVLDRYAPRSVVDVGCGAGFWLRACERHGVARVRGFTPRDDAGAAQANVTSLDLACLGDAVDVETARHGRFDVCLALDVAHALAPASHPAFIDACTQLSDTVVFSSRLPGGPGVSPYARPLAYWSDLFWQAGYALDDRLRPAVEERWGFPRTVFDVLLAFRRRPSHGGFSDEWLRAHNHTTAMRLHDLYEQSVWWAVRANHPDVPPPAQASGPAVCSPTRPWTVPAWRMAGEPGAMRTVWFRTEAARWFVTDARAAIEVLEDDRRVPQCPDVASLEQRGLGGWSLWRDALTIRSTDGTDPRTNGRHYAVVLPAFVAWAEEQSLEETLRLGL